MPTLHWLGRDDAVCAANNTPFHLLEHVPNLSAGDPDSENLLIQGDNLAALKALLPVYAGRVKCIFIDPPYNTGSAFEHYDDNLQHSEWLSLMYPRLELLRELLREDGSIWITIDDDEGHYLKVICDEIFGRKNFVANVVWEKKYSPQNDAKWLSDSHDHVLVYAKTKEVWRPNLLPRSEEMNKRYKNPDNDPRGPWKPADFSVKTYNANCDYPITLPSGRIVNPPESRCWVSNEKRFHELVSDNRIWFGKTGNNVPSLKKFLTEVKQGAVSKTIWFRSEVDDNQKAKKEVKELSDADSFSTPKPERLIERCIILGSNPGDLVLDSFLGSGTTAAVAHKMGRRYIGIEMGDHAETHCVPRMRKVIEGEQGGISKAVNWEGGGGFRFMRLGPSVFDETGVLNPEIRFAGLAAHIWFSETGTGWQGTPDSPLIGVHDGVAHYLLFNGILGDRRPDSGNVLNTTTYKMLPPHEGPKIVYGEWSQWREDRLRREHITFKMIPYEIKVR